MGWCSGTPIFDAVAKEVLNNSDLTEEQQATILTVLIKAMWSQDWDCEQDSAYYEHPVVESIFRKLEPEWFED